MDRMSPVSSNLNSWLTRCLVCGVVALAVLGVPQEAVAQGTGHIDGVVLGAGGTERSREHAEASARLVTAMDPEFVSLLTLTVIPGTPIARLEATGRFELASVEAMLGELRTVVALAEPTAAIFRTNHASNYLPLSGRLPRDRDRLVGLLDSALAGEIRLREEWMRGL